MRREIAVAIVLLIVGIASFSYLIIKSNPSEENLPEGAAIVLIIEGSYNPAQTESFLPKRITVTLGVNDTIVWINEDTQPHTVTSTKGIFDSKLLQPGGKWVHTFTQPGNYPYYCQPHPWMTGEVVVLGSM